MEAPVAAPQVGFVSSTLSFLTSRGRDFIDLTDLLAAEVRKAGVSDGLLVVTSQHTTAAVIVNEHEPELLKDLDRMLSELAPEDGKYAHNRVPCLPGERPNGHAHCQALLLGTSVTLPIVAGRIILGRFQRVFLVELDCARARTVRLTLLGT